MNDAEKELTKAAAEVAGKVAEDIIRPTSISIGENIGLMVDGVMGWLGCWGEKQKIKQQQYISDFKQQLLEKLSNIAPEHLCEPKISTVGPAIEASKYFYEEEHYREMFSELLAASCNAAKVNFVHPAFTVIIQQLSPIDAKLFNMFQYKSTYPCVDVVERHCNGKLTPFRSSLFDFFVHSKDFTSQESLQLTSSLDNLIRLGVINKNSKIIENDYDYSLFCENALYKACKAAIAIDSTVEMRKYRIELTEFGRAFAKCCLQIR